MGAVSSIWRALSVGAFVIVLVSVSAGGAEIHIGVDTGRIGLILSDEPVNLDVRLSAWEVTESRFVRRDWIDVLQVSARDSSGQHVDLAITNAHLVHEGASGVQKRDASAKPQALWTSRARLEVGPLQPGEYAIKATYGEIDSAVIRIRVLRGDETPQVVSKKLQREAERPGVPFAKYRELQLERLGIEPTDETIWWELADKAVSCPTATLTEVEQYFTRAVGVESERRSAAIASQDKDRMRRIEGETALFEMRVRVAAAYHELLSDLFKDRDNLMIRWIPQLGTVRLEEKKSHRVVRAIPVPRGGP